MLAMLLAPETEAFCQFPAPETLLKHVGDFWKQKLTFFCRFSHQKFLFIIFWIQTKISAAILTSD